MGPAFGLPDDTRQNIKKVLANFKDIDKVLIYGSRALGREREGSDIDLCLFSQDPHFEASKVSTALEDLNLPYVFDISCYQQLDNPNFIDHINRVGLPFYEREKFLAERQNEEAKAKYLANSHQSEAVLEANLIKKLNSLGYESVNIKNADDLRENLKAQLEKHNKVTLSAHEFKRLLSQLDRGSVFERAKILRDKIQLKRDDGTALYIELLNTEHWCQNQYQLAHQISQEGHAKNRYDVTLLINGLPLVQIELKRRGMELKEAFNQINRYQRHSFWSENGLFQYVQLFIISNGVNTKYLANNRRQEYGQTFYWADVNNQLITQLDAFADAFLEKCHLSKMICKYIVLHESFKILMVLRPYQYYAVEAIVNRVKNSKQNGYIWHTTGSGKTLTSFKASQILQSLPNVHKVMFVVDRADLDYQTSKEFNYFSEGSVDSTDDTKTLVKQMAGDKKLIVTTLQKLNSALTKNRHVKSLENLKDNPLVFIFDECHRSQFGASHKTITEFFSNAQMFGFTGTPIFDKNATANEHGKRTTADLFGSRLHQYVITDAIADENVLKFSVEYWGNLKTKSGELIDETEQAKSLNLKEFFGSKERIGKVVDWIIQNHNRKTYNRQFSAILCVQNVEELTKYYDNFYQKKEKGLHDLRVVTVFSFAANEEDKEANGEIGDPDFDLKLKEKPDVFSRDKLEKYIGHYNAMYGTGHSLKDGKAFYAYYKDIAKRYKEREKDSFSEADRADILIVVNMFLTGFDAKKLNTLYVDKNLKYHGLIQAFSRTNRIFGELKSQGNIVCFRNLKNNTDEAVKLFSNKNPTETIFVEPYEHYVELFKEALSKLKTLAATPAEVDNLIREEDKLEFIKQFRQLLRQHNVLRFFTEFDFKDLDIAAQEFEDYKSKYLDLYESSRNGGGEGASILEEVDFALELIHKDEINVNYILNLLGEIQSETEESGTAANSEEKTKNILNLLSKEPSLRSKKELIEKFIKEYLPHIKPPETVDEHFEKFWHKERKEEFSKLCADENLKEDTLSNIIQDFHFSGKRPLRETVLSALNSQPKLLERKKIYQRVLDKILKLIEKFDDNLGG